MMGSPTAQKQQLPISVQIFTTFSLICNYCVILSIFVICELLYYLFLL